MKTIDTLLRDDITIWYPLRNGKGIYESIPYSLIGSIGSFSDAADLVRFIQGAFLNEEDCINWCNQMNLEEEVFEQEMFEQMAQDHFAELDEYYRKNFEEM